jgi:hypothetical protein
VLIRHCIFYIHAKPLRHSHSKTNICTEEMAKLPVNDLPAFLVRLSTHCANNIANKVLFILRR